MKFNVLNEQRKSQIISRYLDTISKYKVEASETANSLNISIGGSSFKIDTSKKYKINERKVLSR